MLFKVVFLIISGQGWAGAYRANKRDNICVLSMNNLKNQALDPLMWMFEGTWHCGEDSIGNALKKRIRLMQIWIKMMHIPRKLVSWYMHLALCSGYHGNVKRETSMPAFTPTCMLVMHDGMRCNVLVIFVHLLPHLQLRMAQK